MTQESSAGGRGLKEDDGVDEMLRSDVAVGISESGVCCWVRVAGRVDVVAFAYCPLPSSVHDVETDLICLPTVPNHVYRLRCT